MSRKKRRGTPPKFPWRVAMRNAGVKGTEAGVLAAATTAVTAPEPVTIAIIGSIGFVGGTLFGLGGEYMNHRTDDPLPVFDARTTLLFDTVGMVLGYLLFVIPALHLDHSLSRQNGLAGFLRWFDLPDSISHGLLPGAFGLFALCLTAFLLTVLRGLICNLGLAREEEEEGAEA